MPLAARIGITLLICAIAAYLGLELWTYYVLSPWTRDGRVTADVVTVAPEVAGRVIELPVKDNQFVRRGDALLTIDPSSYRIAVQQAAANADAQQATMAMRQADARRLESLTSVAVTAQQKEDARLTAQAAAAAYQQAVAALDAARLALERTVVHSPINGWVTNLHLDLGDYTQAGQAVVAVVDSDSFRVEGYFEETKIRRIRPNDRADIELMSGGPVLSGHVQGVSYGITNADNPAGPQLLPSVNPIFSWVRLAQRFPVRIELDPLPEGVTVRSGMTCSVRIRETSHEGR